MADENQRVWKALERLAVSLKELAQTKKSSSAVALSHWRSNVPEALTTSLSMLEQGNELVRATCTKYTLVTKIDLEEGSKLAKDLLRGCEWMATCSLVVHDDAVGCSHSLRKCILHAVRAAVFTCSSLVQVFCDAQADATAAAQKTGAVWDACDKIAKLPKNNRNAMRRELMTWKMECQDSLQEFTELLQVASADGAAISTEQISWEVFSTQGASSEDYSETEHAIAVSCLTLVKCSRGSLAVTLQALDVVGDADLGWVQKVHTAARAVGEGMTDMASLLYPPLEYEDLQEEVTSQSNAIIMLHSLVLEQPPMDLPTDVVTLSTNIRAACERRSKEALEGIHAQL